MSRAGWLAAASLALPLGYFMLSLLSPAAIEDGDPQFSGPYLLQTILIALISAGVVRWLHQRPGPGPVKVPGRFGSAALFALLLGGARILWIFLKHAERFSSLSLEYGWVENTTVAFLLPSCLLCLGALRKRRRLEQVVLFLAAAFLMLDVLEETSWHWVLRFRADQAPSLVHSNQQSEFNLHNLATDAVETLYYYFAFVCLVWLPYLDERTGLLRRRLPTLVPGRLPLLAAMLPTAFGYEMWNVYLTQFAFFASVWILVSLLCRSDASEQVFLAPWLTLLVGTQLCVILYGHHMVRAWEDTEWREMLIAFSFLLYSCDLFNRGSTGTSEPHPACETR